MESSLNELLPALQRLDRLLEEAVAAAQAVYGPEAAADPHRGLYIGDGEVAQLLARGPGSPLFQNPGITAPLAESLSEQSRWHRLKQTFGLSSFDLDLLLITLAPELDLRYERLYAYLQDDVTRRRPSVDLAFNLLCPSAEVKLARRTHLASDAPLIRHGLLVLLADSHQLQPPLLAQYLKLDEQIVSFLLGQDSLGVRLTPFCQLVEPAIALNELPVSTEIKQALPLLTLQARQSHQPLKLHFHGLHGTGKRRTAEALAGAVGTPLLVVDLARALAANTDFEQLIKLVLHTAVLPDALVYCDGLDALLSNERTLQYQYLLNSLNDYPGITVLASTQPWTFAGSNPTGMITVPFPMPDFSQRRTCLETNLAAAGITLAAADLETLAGRFQLTPGQIAATVVTACNQARWRAAAGVSAGLRELGNAQPTLDELFAAARAQSSHGLTTLARKVEPKYTWDDIVLPADQLAQLKEICNQANYRHIVYGEWGFARKLALGKGLNVLFSGPPGTGKTMAADVIANELCLDLYEIDLSQVVSKYIGETEKNLDRIFTAAQNANAILFFDEADALFGKRSEVKDAHDRYANIEVGYLLQKMEEYEGVAILATNLRSHMDEAFVRRMHVIVEFPFPDEDYRRRIWEVVFPREAPLGEDVDFGVLAREVKLAGGNIKNIGLTAAFYAASDGGVIRMPHLIRAARREHQKLGRMWNEVEWSA